jgi:hypothetical protein
MGVWPTLATCPLVPGLVTTIPNRDSFNTTLRSGRARKRRLVLLPVIALPSRSASSGSGVLDLALDLALIDGFELNCENLALCHADSLLSYSMVASILHAYYLQST